MLKRKKAYHWRHDLTLVDGRGLVLMRALTCMVSMSVVRNRRTHRKNLSGCLLV